MDNLQSASSVRKLHNGNEIPVLGLGVFGSPEDVTIRTCLEAIKVGYRHIDTAAMYGNEGQVGQALREAGVSREEVFVTTKLYHPPDTAEATRTKLVEGIDKIGGPNGYVDMLLIHNSNIGPEARTRLWKEMEKLHQEGRIKNIGVSNYGIQHLEHLREYATVWPPAVNQLELHPWLQQHEIVDYCKKNGIAVEAYCPLVRNQKAKDPTLTSIADKHGKSTAQVLVRYCLQKDWIPLPKSDNPDRIRQNADVFDWVLDGEDMSKLDGVPQEKALVIAVDNKDRDFIWNPKGM